MRMTFIILLLSLFALLQACSAEKEPPQSPDSAAENAPVEEELVWLTEYNQALKTAAEQGRPVFIDFTGSDWCHWCIKLDKEVFSQPEFKAYAREKLVLLKLDFPRSIPQSPAVKAANQALAEKYNIEGYPTIVLTDASGNEIQRTGYQAGGAQKYVAHLQNLLSTE